MQQKNKSVESYKIENKIDFQHFFPIFQFDKLKKKVEIKR